MQNTQDTSTQAATHKTSTPHSKLLQIEREFSAPVERLFNAFSSAELLKIWWWPKNLYTDQIEMDFREGGRYFINIKGLEVGGGGMTGRFEKIIKDRLIVMTDNFADEQGRPISAEEAKMPGVWPERLYITLEFELVNQSKSRLKLSQEGIPNEMQNDCIQGWNESFDKLEDYWNQPQH